jgi:hypothetical protein
LSELYNLEFFLHENNYSISDLENMMAFELEIHVNFVRKKLDREAKAMEERKKQRSKR